MSEFKDILGKARPEPNFEGSFECQQCFVIVDFAYYDANKQRLTWYCPDNHESKIEEFRL